MEEKAGGQRTPTANRERPSSKQAGGVANKDGRRAPSPASFVSVPPPPLSGDAARPPPPDDGERGGGRYGDGGASCGDKAKGEILVPTARGAGGVGRCGEGWGEEMWDEEM